MAYPKSQLDELWKLLLTNQFHDILPGSSIALVYEDTQRDHATIQQQGTALKDAALAALSSDQQLQPVNTTSFDRTEITAGPDGQLVCASAPSYGIGATVEARDEVTVSRDGEQVILENGRLRAVLNTDGTLASLTDKEAAREALAGAGNQLLIYDDHPTAWDAWEVDLHVLETARACAAADTCELVTEWLLRAEVEVTRKIGLASTMQQRVRLDAGSGRLEFHTRVDWHEDNKMLKVAFPVDVRALNATYEMQFGYVERPTPYNSSQDLARFEVPGHRWVDLSEHGFGVSLLTDCKYGYHTLDNTMHITLLRSPKSPDPEADMGHHEFAYAVFPHVGSWQDAGVVGEACSFNTPLSWAPVPAGPRSFFRLHDTHLVLDTVKQAEDSDALVLRLYEAHGARGSAELEVGLPCTSATVCNTLEEDGEALEVTGGVIEIPYRPHQLISVKMG